MRDFLFSVMDRQALIDTLSQDIRKKNIVNLRREFRKSGRPLAELVSLSFSEDEGLAWRASWLLENVLIGKLGFYSGQIAGIFNAFPHVQWPGCRRHYGKMVARMSDPRSAFMKKWVPEKAREPVVETCFEWLINEKEKVAVKVFCVQILFNLRGEFDWVTEELRQQLPFLMRDGSAAMQAKGRKILSALGA
ncbi:MAG: hypothetical protein INR69_01075 [Mucilaginibacter polytrichastri]|nr:hypothetical protein [Mucilaginibacter polytrichastri]